MGAIDQTQGNRVLNAILTQTAGVVSTSPLKCRLGSTNPTNIANMTEITGTGYTAGGNTVAFATATGSAGTTSNSGTLTWTNSSGSSWTINGIEIWDAGPLRWLYGTWIGAPITVANGNTFSVAIGGVVVTIV